MESNEQICVDMLLMSCPENMKFNCNTEIDKLNDERFKGSQFKDKVRFIMIDCNYVETFPNRSVVLLTPHGRHVKSMGGHLRFLEFSAEQDNKIAAKEELEQKNLESTIGLNVWLYKTRWLPHILALIAVAVSIWALIKSYQDSTP